MHEELFLNRLKQYEDSGLSLDRILLDPIFKGMPLAEKVDLLKKHGHTIQQGTRLDKKFWKDIGWGTVGTAVMLAEPIMSTVTNVHRGFKYGQDLGYSKAVGDPLPEQPTLETKGYKGLAQGTGAAVGLGLAAPKFYMALAARKNMNMVKKLLSDQPGANTADDAINVIARS